MTTSSPGAEPLGLAMLVSREGPGAGATVGGALEGATRSMGTATASPPGAPVVTATACC